MDDKTKIGQCSKCGASNPQWLHLLEQAVEAARQQTLKTCLEYQTGKNIQTAEELAKIVEAGVRAGMVNGASDILLAIKSRTNKRD